jgi:hypothetical protein
VKPGKTGAILSGREVWFREGKDVSGDPQDVRAPYSPERQSARPTPFAKPRGETYHWWDAPRLIKRIFGDAKEQVALEISKTVTLILAEAAKQKCPFRVGDTVKIVTDRSRGWTDESTRGFFDNMVCKVIETRDGTALSPRGRCKVQMIGLLPKITEPVEALKARWHMVEKAFDASRAGDKPPILNVDVDVLEPVKMAKVSKDDLYDPAPFEVFDE